jgi:signal transduction histidine kinase
MNKAWTPRARWIFLVATLLCLFSTAQGYRLTSINPRARPEDLAILPLLALNAVLWYVPAALLRPIFWISSRYRLDSGRWMRAIAVHLVAFIGFSVIHTFAMLGVRIAVWPELLRRTTIPFLAWVQTSYLSNVEMALMMYAAIVGLCYAFGYYHESQARAVTAANLETSLVEARLKTLEAELHPHFLFNTLHAISTLVHSDPEAADRMISRLSDLLRLTFDRSGAAQVTLKEELEFLQKYLEIEQIRFQDRLSIHFEIDPETLDAEVPRLILQPLVENAIKHGISPRAGRGHVQISAMRRDAVIWIEVQDNGVGLSTSARARLNSGVGLSNTRARLEYLYGDAQRLEFAEADSGLSVRLQIPAHRVSPQRIEGSAQVA